MQMGPSHWTLHESIIRLLIILIQKGGFYILSSRMDVMESLLGDPFLQPRTWKGSQKNSVTRMTPCMTVPLPNLNYILKLWIALIRSGKSEYVSFFVALMRFQPTPADASLFSFRCWINEFENVLYDCAKHWNGVYEKMILLAHRFRSANSIIALKDPQKEISVETLMIHLSLLHALFECDSLAREQEILKDDIKIQKMMRKLASCPDACIRNRIHPKLLPPSRTKLDGS